MIYLYTYKNHYHFPPSGRQTSANSRVVWENSLSVGSWLDRLSSTQALSSRRGVPFVVILKISRSSPLYNCDAIILPMHPPTIGVVLAEKHCGGSMVTGGMRGLGFLNDDLHHTKYCAIRTGNCLACILLKYH